MEVTSYDDLNDNANGNIPIEPIIIRDVLRFIQKANKTWSNLQYWDDNEEEMDVSYIISKTQIIIFLSNEKLVKSEANAYFNSKIKQER
jgi:hypothetical protein